jgi:diguanylate cyclase (GGDEF)-like protein/PAS domain S-box-containing protein
VIYRALIFVISNYAYQIRVNNMSLNDEMKNNFMDIALANKVINSANDGITVADLSLADRPLIFINQAFEHMTGYKQADVIGRNCRFLQGALHDQPELFIIRQAINNLTTCRVTLKNFKKDGTLFWNELSLAPIFDENDRARYYVGVQKDVTSEIVQKERITYLAERDDLTGLYNYRGFFNRVDALLEKGLKDNLMISIGMADIDFFKEVNDKFGHIKANNILKIVGSELMQAFDSDTIISRFGGDEFCFASLLNEINTEAFYEKIARAVQSTNSVLANGLQISISSGFVIEGVNKETRIDRLINAADKIMYLNKNLTHLERIKKQNQA